MAGESEHMRVIMEWMTLDTKRLRSRESYDAKKKELDQLCSKELAETDEKFEELTRKKTLLNELETIRANRSLPYAVLENGYIYKVLRDYVKVLFKGQLFVCCNTMHTIKNGKITEIWCPRVEASTLIVKGEETSIEDAETYCTEALWSELDDSSYELDESLVKRNTMQQCCGRVYWEGNATLPVVVVELADGEPVQMDEHSKDTLANYRASSLDINDINKFLEEL